MTYRLLHLVTTQILSRGPDTKLYTFVETQTTPDHLSYPTWTDMTLSEETRPRNWSITFAIRRFLLQKSSEGS